jgi:hypothetical protein
MDFCEIWYWLCFMKIFLKTPNFGSTHTKIWGSLHEDLSMLWAVQRDHFVAFHDNTFNICIVNSDVVQHYQENTLLCFHGNSGHTSMAQFYIIRTCPVVFIVHIHVYHTPISVFFRYENLNCVCSVRFWCSFLFCVVMCNVCSSQMCLSTYILRTAATVNWRASHTDDREHWLVTFTSCQHLQFINLMFFSRKNQSTQKSEEKEANCGIPTLKAKVLLLAVIVTHWLRDMRKV